MRARKDPGALEGDVQKNILFALNTYGGVVAWRNNSGMIKRKYRYGLEKGASDIVALVSVERANGSPLAVPMFIECKRERGGKQSVDQETFMAKVQRYGAYGDFCRSVESALALVDLIRREVA
jgi:hypothetical protein